MWMWRRVLLASMLVVAACQGSTGSADDLGAAVVASTVPSTATPSTAAPTTSAPSTTATTSTASKSADVVFVGGPVVTMDPDLGTQEAIALAGDRIMAIGSEDDISRLEGPDTTVIDLAGRAILPGFVDPHTHVLTDMGGIEAGQTLALAAGMTSVADASIEPGLEKEFVATDLAGALRVRATLYLTRTDVCGEDLGTWYEAYQPGEQLSERVRIGGVKVFTDGGACRALATSEPILDGYDSTDLYFDVDTLTDIFGTADAAGYQLLVHAQGDVAIATAQDAFARILDDASNPLRHRIDHSAVQTDATIGRYTDIGVIPVLFGPGAACDADAGWTDFYRAHGDRPGDVVRANPDLRIAWHGDDPSLPPVSPIDDLWSLITRGSIADDGSRCEPADWMRGAEIDRDRALRMMTIDAAYVIGQDDEVGSLVPGRYADLVVLSDDLATIPIDQIPDVQVLATVVGGVTEYCAAGADEWCPASAPRADLPDGIEVSASASRSGQGPERAFDGVATDDSFWSSGADAPQWYRIDFSQPSTVSAVRLTVFQNPTGETAHDLEALVADEWLPVESFRGFTTTGDVLTWAPEEPIESVSALRITTLSSPSWPEWYDVEVDMG